MAHRPHRRITLVLGLALATAGCGWLDDRGPEPPPGAIRLEFEDREAPEVLDRTGLARRDGADAPTGLWGVVSRLRAPERAIVRNLDSGSEVAVALYAGSPGGGGAIIRLSPQASDLLGIGEAPVTVRVVALRREPVIVPPERESPTMLLTASGGWPIAWEAIGGRP